MQPSRLDIGGYFSFGVFFVHFKKIVHFLCNMLWWTIFKYGSIGMLDIVFYPLPFSSR